MKKVIILLAAAFGLTSLAAQTKQISLNGEWNVAIGDKMPQKYLSKVPVPGLITQAAPSLGEDLDANFIKEPLPYNYVWYERQFTMNEATAMPRAILSLRAKYNAEVWVNGKLIGYDHHTSYTFGHFDITSALNQRGTNTIVVRVGSWNTSSEPSKDNSSEWWRNTRAPGLWDDVTLTLTQKSYIDFLQIIPDVKAAEVKNLVTVANDLGSSAKYILAVAILDGTKTIEQSRKSFSVGAGAKEIVDMPLSGKNLTLWTPGKEGNPKMYTLRVTLSDASGKTLGTREQRFGYRSVEIKGTDVLLNGKKILYRAENLAWVRAYNRWADTMFDTTWIRKFLRAAVQDYNFNFMRVHLGHGYSKLYEIASEEGLMLQDEWRYMHDKEPEGKAREECIIEFNRWVRDNINQTSIVGWDQENEGHVLIVDIIADLKRFDPTRYWGEHDFRTTHDYAYSENVVPTPVYPRSDEKPSTVLESCRLWFNEWGLPEPMEAFKTSRTATTWGIYYYTKPDVWRLQSDIHADMGTFYRTARYQGWAPFTMLSGRFNGHNYYLGNIADSLTPQPNLTVLRQLNEPLGASIDMLQVREWYKEKKVYLPSDKYTKRVVAWNDFDTAQSVEAELVMRAVDGREILRQRASMTIPAYGTAGHDFVLTMPTAQGVYTITPYLTDKGRTIEGVTFRLMVARSAADVEAGYMAFGGIYEPVKGGYSTLANFIGKDISPVISKAISDYVEGGAVDKLSVDKGGNFNLQFTRYNDETSYIINNVKISPDGKVVSHSEQEAIIYMKLDDGRKAIIAEAIGAVPVDESRIIRRRDESGNDVYEVTIIGKSKKYRVVLTPEGRLVKK